MIFRSLAAVAFGLMLCGSALANFDSGIVNIDFCNTKDTHQTGKAVIGAKGDVWNAPTGNTGNAIPLTDATDKGSDVTVTFDAENIYDAGDSPFVGTDVEVMLRDYLYTHDPRKVTLGGLTPNAKYDVYLFNASNPGGDGRKTKFTIGDQSKTATFDTSKKVLTEDVNYVHLIGTADKDGNLLITYQGANDGDGPEGNLCGLQFTPATSGPASQPKQ